MKDVEVDKTGATERSSTASPPEEDLYAVAPYFAGTAAGIGAVVLVGGWGLGSETLQSISPALGGMSPSSSICFVLIGSALLCLGPLKARLGARSDQIALGLSVVVAVAAVLNLAVRAFTDQMGLDALVFPPLQADTAARMSIATSLNFIAAAGCAIVLCRTETRRGRLAYVALNSAGLVIAMTAMMTYMFNPMSLAAAGGMPGIAMHTAIGFMLVFLALLFMRPDWGWLPILIGPGEGSIAARRLFPALAAAPIVIVFGVFVISRFESVSPFFRLSAMAIAGAAFMAVMVLRSGAIQNEDERRLLLTLRELRTTVEARDMLLREVYHRVKNNLQQINAMVGIAAIQTSDPQTREAFEAITRRVRALGAAHEMLLGSADLTSFDVKPFLEDLCREIANGMGAAEAGVEVRVEAASDHVTIDFGVPLGLLVNELVTNALKHAFPDQRKGRILVRYALDQTGKAELMVADDGVGLPGEESSWMAGGQTGGAIIRSLTAQLDATMTVAGRGGVTVKVNCPAEARSVTR